MTDHLYNTKYKIPTASKAAVSIPQFTLITGSSRWGLIIVEIHMHYSQLTTFQLN